MKSKLNIVNAENRTIDRSAIELRTIVQVKTSDKDVWKEITKVTTVSRNGAGFNLKRACNVGRLVSLVLPMPEDLRAYGYGLELYPVLGLVQYCNAVKVDGESVFHTGVALIGKQIPDSYKVDPQQSYRIRGMTDEGLWDICEAKTPFKNRKHPRFWVGVDVTISLLKSKNKSVTKESSVTQNISASGLSVTSLLDVKVGGRVKIASEEYNFYSFAEVKNRTETEG